MITGSAIGWIAATTSVGLMLLGAGRWVRRRSELIGVLLQVGILLRVALVGLLFWISYLDWPPLRGLHSGDGFWELAPDARSYYLIAADALERGRAALGPATPSPTFVAFLAAWMSVTGPTAPGAALLNILCYSFTCVLAVWVLDPPAGRRRRDAALVVVAALSFSPALLLFGTQPLKDQLFVSLIALACAALWRWTCGAGDWRTDSVLRRGAAIGVLGIAAALLAGIRAYFVPLLVAGVGVSAVARFFDPRRSGTRARLVIESAGVLVFLWACFAVGVGSDYQYYARVVGLDRTSPAGNPVAVVESARTGFVAAGGATTPVNADGPAGVVGGILAVLIPVNILRWLGLVQFSGGRGLLAFTDIDTLFNLLTCLAVGTVLYRNRQTLNRPYALAIAGLALGLVLLMGYVVTNFGTLFRLRSMAMALVWLLPLAIGHESSRAAAKNRLTRPEENRPASPGPPPAASTRSIATRLGGNRMPRLSLPEPIPQHGRNR